MKKAMLNKLSELGYEHYQKNMYVKNDIVLKFEASKIIDNFISVGTFIRNIGDLQELDKRIFSYFDLLETMQKDLEELKNVEEA